jgi:hypothetical protein
VEKAHPGGSGAGRGAEWVDRRGEWVVPEQVQDQGEIACVQNAERLSLMKQERRATL